ncbi:hypothetical protein [Acanthopleuribacter pedis]|nr:hypothetical protein [Acanthopleuribacter pedis]
MTAMVGMVVLCMAGMAQEPPDLNPLGTDPLVDYNDLFQRTEALGIPWDDRNLGLSQEDLAVLPERDFEDIQQVPVFYRVLLRQRFPHLQRSGRAQYPRSAPEQFRLEFGALRRAWDKTKPAAKKGDTAIELEANNNVSGERYGAESAIAVHPTNPDLVIVGTNGVDANGVTSRQRHYYSTDGGRTWQPAAGAAPLPNSCCDPTMDWSPDGQYAYAAALAELSGGGGVWFYRSDDAGASWNRTAIISSGNFEDKEYMHVDKFNCGVNPHCGNIYVTWHVGNSMRLSRSDDNGASFTTFVHQDSQSGIGSDVTSDENGVVYHFWPETQARLLTFAVSTDGGLNFGPRQTVTETNASFIYNIPSFDRRLAFVHVSAATDLSGGAYHNRMYLCWNDHSVVGNVGGTSLVRVAYSDDGGQSWQITQPHRDKDPFATDRFNPWMEIDRNGWVHVVYYDTRNDPARLRTDMYHTYSRDGGATWAPETRLTESSSQRMDDGFQWGDYNGLAIVGDEIRPVWTDNRFNSGGRGYTVVGRIAGGIVPEFTPAFTAPLQDPQCPGSTAPSVTVTSQITGGFSQEITYAFDPPLPEGFEAVFSENPVQPDGSTAVTLSLDPFVMPGDYAFRLVGRGAGKSRDLTYNLSVSIGPGPIRPIWGRPELFNETYDLDQNRVINVLDLVASLNCQTPL